MHQFIRPRNYLGLFDYQEPALGYSQLTKQVNLSFVLLNNPSKIIYVQLRCDL